VSVPDPVSVSFSAAEEAAWYARLPTMFAAAAALFTSADGRVLLVKPNYRDHWSLPGGILEHGEPPHEGCRREVKEELGLDITPGRRARGRLGRPARGAAQAGRALRLRRRDARR
jgi:8-oxo-dGTP pyrophosphatase MutT (NUDIX family)